MRADIAAAAAVHRDLGPDYTDAVSGGLVERIGSEIDKRVDARLAQRGPAAPAAHSAEYVGKVILRALRTGEERIDIPHGPEQPQLTTIPETERGRPV